MAATIKTWLDNNPPQVDDVDLNGFKEENNRLISSSGQGLNTADNDQTTKAIAIYASGGADYYTDSGTANAYILTITGTKKVPPAYFDGMRIRFVPANTNTGASTVNAGSLGLTNLKNINGNSLSAGDVLNGIAIDAVYFSGEFRIIGTNNAVSINDLRKDTYIYGNDVGSVNSVVVTPSNAYPAYIPGMVIEILINNTNTGASTLEISGHGAVDIKVATPIGLKSLSGNEMVDGCIYKLQFNGSDFQLINPSCSKVLYGQISYAPNTTQALSVGVWTKVLFDGTPVDSNGWWDNVNHRWIPTIPGIFDFNALLFSTQANAAESTEMALYKNGSLLQTLGVQPYGNGKIVGGSTLVTANGSGDYFELFAHAATDVATLGRGSGLGKTSNLFEIEYVGS